MPSLEIHDVLPNRAALKTERRIASFVEHGEIDAETLVGFLCAGDRLEHQVQGRAFLDQADLVGDVGQDAGLGRNLVLLDHLVEQVIQRHERRDTVGGRVDANHRITRPVEQAVEHRGGDATRVIGGVVGLQTHRESPRQAHRVAERRHHPTLARDEDKVLVAHQFAHRRGHLRGDTGCDAGEGGRVRRV